MLVGGGVLLLGLGQGAHLRAGDAALARAQARGAELQVTWQQQADQAARLAGEQARLLQLQRRLREAQAPLLPEGGLPGLLQDIAATGRGLVFEQVNVLAAQARAEYAEVPIQVRVVGDFSQLSGFVDALLGLPRRATLHDLQVSPLDGREQLRLQLQLNAYASGVPVEAPVQAEGALMASRNPFSASTPAPAASVLEGLPVDQLELVGHLADPRGAVALIRAAGALYPVRVGDRLGPDQGRVVRVEAQQLELAERVWVEGGGWVVRSRVIGVNAQRSFN
nr:pilus assembly protein PilP [Pseudomonas aegrilactucae]